MFSTPKQFFIQGFFKAGTIRGVLERNPQTLAAAKVAAREMEHIDRRYEILWRREDEGRFTLWTMKSSHGRLSDVIGR
jgi:hypothetical protein